MSALQQYGGADLVVTPTIHKESHPSWTLFAMVWVSSIFLAFLCGILFWHLWGPRFHQMSEVLGGISWTLKSGIRGALVSTWRMLMWGVLNLVETKVSYETEPVQNPHMVEIDRMPPPPAEESEEMHGMRGGERMDATPTRHQRSWTPDVEAPWELASPNGNRTREVHQRNRRGMVSHEQGSVLSRMVEASRPARLD